MVDEVRKKMLDCRNLHFACCGGVLGKRKFNTILRSISYPFWLNNILKKVPIDISYLPTINAKINTTTRVRLTSVKHTPVAHFFF